MAAVVADDAVRIRQVGADPCGDGFLPDVGVDVTRDAAGVELMDHPFLKTADGQHPGVQLDQRFLVRTQRHSPSSTKNRKRALLHTETRVRNNESKQ